MRAYDAVIPATFLSRPNRFVAQVLLDGKEISVHVKNTGRCRELLREGVQVYLTRSDHPNRKTMYDLVTVRHPLSDTEDTLVNVDSQLPNAIALNYLSTSGTFSPTASFEREVTHGDSRFDLCVREGHQRTFVEVKGVTLVSHRVALFPDAPTERGIKHLRGLSRCCDAGDSAIAMFVIQRNDVDLLRPNKLTHPAFAETLRAAQEHGVRILAIACDVTPTDITVLREVPVDLNQ